jgi:hypothetical protein
MSTAAAITIDAPWRIPAHPVTLRPARLIEPGASRSSEPIDAPLTSRHIVVCTLPPTAGILTLHLPWPAHAPNLRSQTHGGKRPEIPDLLPDAVASYTFSGDRCGNGDICYG